MPKNFRAKIKLKSKFITIIAIMSFHHTNTCLKTVPVYQALKIRQLTVVKEFLITKIFSALYQGILSKDLH